MCNWCGHEHDVTALCTKRPTWGRRGFLMLAGAALVGRLLPDVPLTLNSPSELAYELVRIKPLPFEDGRLWFIWREVEKAAEQEQDADLSKLVAVVEYVRVGDKRKR